jgi:glycosyltransferase involved in cell wall biosynthesis
MNRKPVVTAVLPVWRGANCIHETVESILAQTFTDWEMLIMGEPDSDEAVKEISRAYAAKHHRIIYTENDVRLGLAATLNKGIELAGGKYIARVDVDDPACTRRFEKQVEYMEAHGDVAVCGTQMITVSPTSLSHATTYPLESDDIATCMLFHCCNGHSSLFLRRELFVGNGWRYPTDWVQEDFALWLSLVDKAKFANLDEILVERKTGTSDNLTRIHAEKIAPSSLGLLSKFYNKYFGIDLGRYKTSLFLCRYGHDEKLIGLAQFTTWIVESFEIFKAMERANRHFDAAALSRTLRKQWNWMMEKYFCAASWAESRRISLPYLPVEYNGDFTEAMSECLGCGLDETANALKKAADEFVHFVSTDVMIKKFKAVVFGVGFLCENFFEKVPNWEGLFELAAFCDNDAGKIGGAKMGRAIIGADALLGTEFDVILISSRDYYQEIHSQLIEMGIPEGKILPLEIFRMQAR